MSLNLNEESVLEGSILQETAKNQLLTITDIEDVEDKPEDKPTIKVTFQVVEGEHQGKIVSEFYGLYQKMAWKVRGLYLALGLYTTETRINKQNKEVEYKHGIDDDGLEIIKSSTGSIIKADCINELNTYDNKSYVRIKNEQEVK